VVGVAVPGAQENELIFHRSCDIPPPGIPAGALPDRRANLAVAVPRRTTGDRFTHLSEKVGALDGVQAVDTAPILRRVKALTHEHPRP